MDQSIKGQASRAELEGLLQEIERLKKMSQWHTEVEDRWRKFQFIADSSNDFMTLINREYIYEAVNRSYLSTYRQTESEVVGHSVSQVWGEEVFQKDIKPYLDTCFSGQAVHYQSWFDFHDLGPGYYDVSYYPYFNARGWVSHAAVISHDVTAHKKTAEALALSEERYRTALDSNPDPVAALDMDGRVTYLNQAFAQVFGWQAVDCFGRGLEMLLPPELEKEEKLMAAELVAGRGFSGRETIRLSRGGASVPVSISGAAHINSKGRQIGSIITWRDISRPKRMEAQLLHAQKMEAIGTLASGIAHEFNNILQTISGYIELIAEKSQAGKSNLAEVDTAVKRASDLVKRLLSFDRKEEVDLRLVDLNRLVDQSVRMLEQTLPKTITIKTSLSQKQPLINGDATKLEQVILNLGANAKDAMPEGGELSLSTEVVSPHPDNQGHARDSWARLRINDTGQGMSREIRERIFEPFYTTREPGQGTGLGLSIVYSITTDHQGTIDCSSQPGRGTTFDILLPLSPVEAKPKPPRPVKTGQAEVGTKTILLVDDEQSIIAVTRTILESRGYKVLTASNGEKGLEIFQEPAAALDLVILDLGMPGMGGRLCLEKMVQINPKVPVIIASGYSSAETVRQVTEAGATGFVGKPYRMAELLTQVRRVLENS